MQYRNPRFTKFGTIDVEVFNEGEWSPFHVVRGDSDELDQLDDEIRAAGGISPYVAPEPEPFDGEADLTPAQFNWLLAYTGLDDAWDHIEQVTKSTDRETYAMIRAQRSQPRFRLAKVLQMIGQLGALISAAEPDLDLSPEKIKAAWAAALEVSL